MRLSILDIQVPLHLPDVVALAETCGYHRYWVSEHHSPAQSGSPTLATALVAGVSDRLRVGTGGVLLRLQAPMRVAADIALLRTFFPGRIDLGIAGASGTRELAMALSGQPVADNETYQARIEELVRLVTRDPTVACSRFADDGPPQLWLCGTGPTSARVAGELGLRYAYHHHLARRDHAGAAAIGAAYRDAFRPLLEATAPCFAIAAYGSVDDSRASATAAWREAGGGDDQLSASFAGDAGDAAEQIVRLAAAYGADEVLVDCFGPSLAHRLEGLRGLADALGLPAIAEAASEITVETAPVNA